MLISMLAVDVAGERGRVRRGADGSAAGRRAAVSPLLLGLWPLHKCLTPTSCALHLSCVGSFGRVLLLKCGFHTLCACRHLLPYDPQQQGTSTLLHCHSGRHLVSSSPWNPHSCI